MTMESYLSSPKSNQRDFDHSTQGGNITTKEMSNNLLDEVLRVAEKINKQKRYVVSKLSTGVRSPDLDFQREVSHVTAFCHSLFSMFAAPSIQD